MRKCRIGTAKFFTLLLLLYRTSIKRPGIYYLINEDEDNNIAQIYIGQTRNGIIRLDDHNRSKDFWNKAIMFLAESRTFTLDMISGLEKFAIIKA